MTRSAALALIALVAIACGGAGGGGGAAPAAQQGNPAVYQRIAAETDCATLQGEFDTASSAHDRAAKGTPEAEVAIAYMQAALDRMKAVRCP